MVGAEFKNYLIAVGNFHKEDLSFHSLVWSNKKLEFCFEEKNQNLGIPYKYYDFIILIKDITNLVI